MRAPYAQSSERCTTRAPSLGRPVLARPQTLPTAAKLAKLAKPRLAAAHCPWLGAWLSHLSHRNTTPFLGHRDRRKKSNDVDDRPPSLITWRTPSRLSSPLTSALVETRILHIVSASEEARGPSKALPFRDPNTGSGQEVVNTTSLTTSALAKHTKIILLPPGSLLMESWVVRFPSLVCFSLHRLKVWDLFVSTVLLLE